MIRFTDDEFRAMESEMVLRIVAEEPDQRLKCYERILEEMMLQGKGFTPGQALLMMQFYRNLPEVISL